MVKPNPKQLTWNAIIEICTELGIPPDEKAAKKASPEELNHMLSVLKGKKNEMVARLAAKDAEVAHGAMMQDSDGVEDAARKITFKDEEVEEELYTPQKDSSRAEALAAAMAAAKVGGSEKTAVKAPEGEISKPSSRNLAVDNKDLSFDMDKIDNAEISEKDKIESRKAGPLATKLALEKFWEDYETQSATSAPST